MTRAELDDLTPHCAHARTHKQSGALNGRSPNEHAATASSTHNWQVWASMFASRQRAHDQDTIWRGSCRNTARHFSSNARTGTMALRVAIREMQQSLKQSLELYTHVPDREGEATVQGNSPGPKRPPPCSLLRLALATVCQAVQRQPQQIPEKRFGRAR